jgi:hypothetical protein
MNDIYLNTVDTAVACVSAVTGYGNEELRRKSRNRNVEQSRRALVKLVIELLYAQSQPVYAARIAKTLDISQYTVSELLGARNLKDNATNNIYFEAYLEASKAIKVKPLSESDASPNYKSKGQLRLKIRNLENELAALMHVLSKTPSKNYEEFSKLLTQSNNIRFQIKQAEDQIRWNPSEAIAIQRPSLLTSTTANRR